MSQEQRKNPPDWESANRNPPSFSVSQWELRKMLGVPPALFQMHKEQIGMRVKQPLRTFKIN
jgi:hypothetical protein